MGYEYSTFKLKRKKFSFHGRKICIEVAFNLIRDIVLDKKILLHKKKTEYHLRDMFIKF